MNSGKFDSKSAGFFPGRSRGLATGPNKFDVPFNDIPDDMSGSRITQGDVTTNRPFIPDLVKRRRASSAKASPEDRIEAVNDDTELHIREGEILVMPIRQRNFRGGIARYADKETQGAVMSSLRGMRVGPMDTKNPAQWRNSFTFAGVAKTNKQIGGVTEGKRVAASMAGGLSLYTNSIEAFAPGIMGRLEMPSPILAERRRLAESAKEAGVRIDIAKPSIKPERPGDLAAHVQEHFASYVNNFVLSDARRKERDAILLSDPFNSQDNGGSELSHLLQFFICEYGRGSAVDFADSLILGEQLGLCSINFDPAGGVPMLTNLSRAYANVSIRSLDADLGRTIAKLEPGGTLTQANSQGDVNLIRGRRIAKAKVLYELLGLLPRENIDPSPELVDIILMKRLNGLLPASEETDAIRQQTAITQTGPRRNTEQLDSTETRMQNIHANRSRLNMFAFYQWYAGMATNRVAKSLQATKAAGLGDFVIS